jgi:hypothetical protein
LAFTPSSQYVETWLRLLDETVGQIERESEALRHIIFAKLSIDMQALTLYLLSALQVLLAARILRLI